MSFIEKGYLATKIKHIETSNYEKKHSQRLAVFKLLDVYHDQAYKPLHVPTKKRGQIGINEQC